MRGSRIKHGPEKRGLTVSPSTSKPAIFIIPYELMFVFVSQKTSGVLV